MGYRTAVKLIGAPEKCNICGLVFSEELKKPMTSSHQIPDQPTVDHIIPKSKGGKTTKKNIQWLCHKCNQLKADKDAQV